MSIAIAALGIDALVFFACTIPVEGKLKRI
jgi:hypothetical protein